MDSTTVRRFRITSVEGPSDGGKLEQFHDYVFEVELDPGAPYQTTRAKVLVIVSELAFSALAPGDSYVSPYLEQGRARIAHCVILTLKNRLPSYCTSMFPLKLNLTMEEADDLKGIDPTRVDMLAWQDVPTQASPGGRQVFISCGQQSQVFLSHSSANAEFALRLATDLRTAGIPVWKAPESILEGEEWVAAIQRGLATSTHFLLLQSPEAVDSNWVNFEFNTALTLMHQGKMCIVPIDYQLCTPPLFWTQFQQVTGIHDDYSAALLRIQARLEENQPDHPPEPTSPATTLNVTGHGGKAMYSGRPAEPPSTQPDEFLKKRNYLDVESEQFGRHPLSEKLVEIQILDGAEPKLIPAQSWVSFVFHPVNAPCKINTVDLKEKLKPAQRIGRGPEWYRGIPRLFSKMLYYARAVPSAYTASDCSLLSNDKQFTQFIQVMPSGHIEIGITYPLFHNVPKGRLFHFVQLVGCLWQMTYLGKAIYENVGFHGETAIKINLIGTNETYLGGDAPGWASSIIHDVLVRQRAYCQEKNIQIERILALTNSSDEDIKRMIHDVAKDLSDYYELGAVRCFINGTDEFPNDDYEEVRL